MCVVRKMQVKRYHTIEILDKPGYYLVDRVPVLSGDVRLDELSDVLMDNLITCVSHIWHPDFVLTRNHNSYGVGVYHEPYNDEWYDGHIRFGGAVIHYDKSRVDFNDSSVQAAAMNLINWFSHSIVSVYIKNGVLHGNFLEFEKCSLEVRDVFDAVEGDTSWRC